jgi:hypothetical protein
MRFETPTREIPAVRFWWIHLVNDQNVFTVEKKANDADAEASLR